MDSSSPIRLLLVLAGSYVIGCVTTGYYLVKTRTARDIRQIGSGSSGATNVSRVLGWQGFVVTLLIDAAKGAMVVMLARRWQFEPWAVWICVLAVVAGHIWPVQLRFRGGKGVATYLGALAAVNWQIGLMLAALAIPGYLVTRNFTLAGLGAIATLPIVQWAFGFPPATVAGSIVLAGVLLFAHRANIRRAIAQTKLDEPPDRE